MRFWKLYKFPLLLTFVSSFLYWLFAYDLVRTNYTKLIILYSMLWLVFLFLMKYSRNNLKFLTFLAFLFRAIFILAIPNLSQDFYRFIWDGRMILEGFNPYLFTPESFIMSSEFPVAQSKELYSGMGELNGSHFTNYPPINQLCFVIAGLFAGKSILGSAVVLRLLIISADFGILYFGKRLLKQFHLPEKKIFWYILNPFIIIELTGNLHFEGVMLFFLVWSLYLLHKGSWKWAAVVFALSVSVKLIPLLFLPLLFWYFKKNKNHEILKQVQNDDNEITPQKIQIDYKTLISFYAIIGLTTLLLFAPFFSLEFVQNYTETVALWFNNFEFNASIYYLAKEIGYVFRGYNEIAIIGKAMSIVIIVFVMYLGVHKKNTDTKTLIVSMLIAFSVYLFFSTTIHPWYLATLLLLCVFTNYKFPLIWSFIIILSYLAYLNSDRADKSENLWIIALEYLVVYTAFAWEVILLKPKDSRT